MYAVKTCVQVGALVPPLLAPELPPLLVPPPELLPLPPSLPLPL
jgi:hypothetical protein